MCARSCASRSSYLQISRHKGTARRQDVTAERTCHVLDNHFTGGTNADRHHDTTFRCKLGWMVFAFRSLWITNLEYKTRASQSTSTGLRIVFGTCISFALCQTCIAGGVMQANRLTSDSHLCAWRRERKTSWEKLPHVLADSAWYCPKHMNQCCPRAPDCR